MAAGHCNVNDNGRSADWMAPTAVAVAATAGWVFVVIEQSNQSNLITLVIKQYRQNSNE